MDRRIVKAAAGAAVAAGALWTVGYVARRRRRMPFAGKVVLITGGSRGLGLVMARQLSEEGALLALLARDEQELRAAAAQIAARGGGVTAIVCDVTDKGQVQGAIDEVIDFYGRIDVLINNAGIIQVGPMEHMEEDDYEQAWAVHVRGPLYMTQAVVPHMKRSGGGRVVNITSIGGEVAVPHLLPYTVSKFALVGLSDGLRAELRKYGILVTTVVPGTMRIGSPVNALFKGDNEAEYAWFSVASSVPGFSTGAERAARRIIDAARYGQPTVVIGISAKLAVKVNALFPNLSGMLAAAVDALLPAPQPGRSTRSYRGWQSESKWAPSALTKLSDDAAARNNEAPAPPPPPESQSGAAPPVSPPLMGGER